MADYPSIIRGWNTKRDLIDPIFALHFNQTQAELSATETTVGTNPQIAVADPAKRTPNYGTLTSRVQSAARNEPMCSYRGTNTAVLVQPNEYYRPSLTAIEDTHGAATLVGYRLPQTGYWMITAKVDWTPTPASVANMTSRMCGIELDGVDVGLRDWLLENDGNRDNMTTTVTWQEHLVEGTDISVVTYAILPDPNKAALPANVYLRCYLVRCIGEGAVQGIPSLEFAPDPVRPPPLDDGCQNVTSLYDHNAVVSPPVTVSSHDVTVAGGYLYDDQGRLMATNYNPYDPPPLLIDLSVQQGWS